MTTAILVAPGTATTKERRNRMLLILMYDSTAEVQEPANLTLNDLHIFDKNPFITLPGKGRKTRNVPLMSKTVLYLKFYLEEFHSDYVCSSDNRALFYSPRDGKPHALSTDSNSLILKRYADKARFVCTEVPEGIYYHLILSTMSLFYAFATIEMMHETMAKANPSAFDKVP